MVPRSLQALLHGISLLCAAVGKPTTCKGCQNVLIEMTYGLMHTQREDRNFKTCWPKMTEDLRRISIAVAL